jgi:[ribosomal protein S5]-alanine N-acetyltransferase
MATDQVSTFTILETERLLLRKLSLNDADEIFILRSDKVHNQYLDRPIASSIEDAIAFINKIDAIVNKEEGFFWAAALKPGKTLAGTIGLWNLDKQNNKAELGYELLPAYYHQGIMTEALAKVLEFGFEKLGLSKIEAWAHPENDRSATLLHKFNFIRDHEAEKYKPEDAIEIIFSLHANDRL